MKRIAVESSDLKSVDMMLRARLWRSNSITAVYTSIREFPKVFTLS